MRHQAEEWAHPGSASPTIAFVNTSLGLLAKGVCRIVARSFVTECLAGGGAAAAVSAAVKLCADHEGTAQGHNGCALSAQQEWCRR